MQHDLKVWPEPFQALWDDFKTHEIRHTRDREFAEGDILLLREWDDFRKIYTGRKVWRRVTYISEGGTFGLPKDLCVLSLDYSEAFDAKGNAL